MTLQVFTARLSYGGPDRLDVTRAGRDPLGIAFAPSWRILNEAKADLREAADWRRRGDIEGAEAQERRAWTYYVGRYEVEMDFSRTHQPGAWKALLARPLVTLVCFCVDPARCHRTLLAGMLGRLGAEVRGERTGAQMGLGI